MKTTSTLTALMIFAITAMMNAQSLNGKLSKTKEPVLLSTNKKVGSNHGPKKEHQRNKKADKKQNMPEPTISAISTEIDQIDKQIAELQKMKAGLDAEMIKYHKEEPAAVSRTVNIVETTIKDNSFHQIQITQIDTYFELQKQTDDLGSKYNQLMSLAKARPKNEKVIISNEAREILSLYEIKQIELSELSARMHMEKYAQNKGTINELLDSYNGGQIVLKMINQLSDEADLAIRMAKEMREEANAQPTKAAKIGTYSNAEEKETLALSKQDEAIDMLHKTAMTNFSTLYNSLALNYTLHNIGE